MRKKMKSEIVRIKQKRSDGDRFRFSKTEVELSPRNFGDILVDVGYGRKVIPAGHNSDY